ncbi:MAG: prepilin-type N-terminal cleavage/methylation domain-containing protein [Candidatus Pacebacteria bacterium]|nr:prepilin-type N-terminal cleavage/methylation domain-containing protein [Candidatus Paceibacterota bacterium]
MNKQKSFTLIELLVVIVIIGILAGVIMISTSSSIQKANIAKVKVFEESIQNNLAANMVSAWDADHVTKDTTWTLNDKWGNNNGTFYDGTVTTCSSSACPQIVNDKQMGNVLSFDGVNDYIDCGGGSSLDISNGLTMTAWINSNDVNKSTHQTVFGKNNQSGGAVYAHQIDASTNGIFSAYFRQLSPYPLVKSNTYLKSNIWYFITTTYDNDSKTAKIFINGKFDNLGTASSGSLFKVGESAVQIGRFPSYSTQSQLFSGQIDDVRIYDAALSSSQIKQNYIASLDSLLSKELISKEEYNARIEALSQK